MTHSDDKRELAASLRAIYRVAEPSTAANSYKLQLDHHALEKLLDAAVALESLPSHEGMRAALVRLCDLKRMKMALETQIGDALELPGGTVRRADIQQYYDTNKEAAW